LLNLFALVARDAVGKLGIRGHGDDSSGHASSFFASASSTAGRSRSREASGTTLAATVMTTPMTCNSYLREDRSSAPMTLPMHACNSAMRGCGGAGREPVNQPNLVHAGTQTGPPDESALKKMAGTEGSGQV
jgi:hypothetical protein